MAGHRSPRGRHAQGTSTVLVRDLIAYDPAAPRAARHGAPVRGAGDRPTGHTGVERGTTDHRTTTRHPTDRSATDRRATDRPTTDRRATDRRATTRPTTDQRTTGHSATAGQSTAFPSTAFPSTAFPSTGLGTSGGRPVDRADVTRPDLPIVPPPLPRPFSQPLPQPQPRARGGAHQQPTKPTLRHTVLASAAAVGAVATGSFASLLPASGQPAAVASAADESPIRGTLSAASAALLRDPHTTAIGTLAPVAPSPDGFAEADAHLSALGKGADIARKIAADAAKAQAIATERARLDQVVASGGVDGWVSEALRVLNLPQSYGPGVKKIIMAESGGNPHAINLTDSNAARGTPSQGLMQTIPSTFRHYVAPAVADRPITDPVANITAGVNYMVANYGTGTLAAGGRTNSYGAYIGY